MAVAFPHPEYSRTVLLPAYEDAQQYFFGHMLDAHEAHAIMLAEQGIITPANALAIADAVATIRAETGIATGVGTDSASDRATAGIKSLDYVPGIEDLFFRTEARIIELAGVDFGANLQIARSRNDLGNTLERMAVRDWLTGLLGDLLALRHSVLALAMQHLDTVLPAYTHTQPAQPATFAHYLAGVLQFLEMDFVRLERAWQTVNRSPLGAAALTGTGFNVDRDRSAALLGFDGPILTTQHAIGAGDHFMDTAFAIQSLAIGLGRVTHDLLIRATAEFGAIRIDDSFIQISSIMPQKRNPVVLEHLRARLSRAVGYAQTVPLQIHGIPYGDTQDIEDEILPPLHNAVFTLRECLTLYATVFATLTLNKEHLRQRAALGFTTATELADTLVRECGLPFRRAHHIVSTLVKRAVAEGKDTDALTLEMLQEVAREVTGAAVNLSDEAFTRALDAQNFVDLRHGLGGTAASSTAAALEVMAETLRNDASALTQQEDNLRAAAVLRAESIIALRAAR